MVAGAFGMLFREGFWRAGLVEGEGKPRKYLWALAGALGFLLAATVFVRNGTSDGGIVSLYIGMLVALSLIDLEEKVIPKWSWVIGAGGAFLISYLCPSVLGEKDGLGGVQAAGLGALVGSGILFGMVEIGKLMFGKLVVPCSPPQPYTVTKGGDGWELSSGGETMPLSQIFMRKRDAVTIKEEGGGVKTIWEAEVDHGDGRKPLHAFDGVATELVIPREAMGFGDVKFMVMLGAMLGWEGAVFSIFAGSVIGTLVGGAAKLLHGHTEIPFVPFLTSGAFVFIVFRDEVGEAFRLFFL